MVERERIRRIYVVGFMGVGKSSVGESLARLLGYRFVDLDREIEREAGRAIPEIFRDDGEAFFRRLEAKALRSAGGHDEVVVACGGGTLTLWENRDFIHRTGVSVWLDAPLEVMMQRCRDSSHRPLLADRARMEALLAERLPGYQQADLRMGAASDPPEALAARIAAMIGRLP